MNSCPRIDVVKRTNYLLFVWTPFTILPSSDKMLCTHSSVLIQETKKKFNHPTRWSSPSISYAGELQRWKLNSKWNSIKNENRRNVFSVPFFLNVNLNRIAFANGIMAACVHAVHNFWRMSWDILLCISRIVIHSPETANTTMIAFYGIRYKITWKLIYEQQKRKWWMNDDGKTFSVQLRFVRNRVQSKPSNPDFQRLSNKCKKL